MCVCVCVCVCVQAPTCCEVTLIVLTEGGERGGQGGERRHGALTQRPEAGVEGVDMEDTLAVEGALLSQLHDLRRKLRRGERGERGGGEEG